MQADRREPAANHPQLRRLDSVSIVPQLEQNTAWGSDHGGISRNTRQLIVDRFRLEGIPWTGALGEIEFLERIFDLKQLPSYDSRFKDAAGDIWQHRVNNPEDWDDDWIFRDSRFAVSDGPDDKFVRFLCEMLHPIVRPDRDEVLRLVTRFNEQLKAHGWALCEEELVAGRPWNNVNDNTSVGDSKLFAQIKARMAALNSIITTLASAQDPSTGFSAVLLDTE